MHKSPKVFTAMVTPLDIEGRMSLETTSLLIEYLLRNDSEGLVVAGTTGESPTLTKKEKLTLFDHVIRVVDGRVPVIAATGSNSTAASIELTQEAEKIGMDGAMVVVPYYNKPSQEGLYRHFHDIAVQTSLPIMLYNVPGRTAVNLHTDTIVKLSQIDTITSLKEAGGDLTHTAEIITHTPEDFFVYCGEDSLTLPMMSVGATGTVSVASHVAGPEIRQMIDAYQTGQPQKAAQQHRLLLPLLEALFAQPSPAPVKAALSLLGMKVGDVRLPLQSLTSQQVSALNHILSERRSDFIHR